MHTALTALALILISVLTTVLWLRQRMLNREAFIRGFAFPKGVFSKVIERHPQLKQKDMELVSRGLRQFFLAYHRSGYRYVVTTAAAVGDVAAVAAATDAHEWKPRPCLIAQLRPPPRLNVPQ